MSGKHKQKDGKGGWAGQCPVTGKRRFFSRKDARAFARNLHHGHMNAYACPHCPGAFHIGHLPGTVLRGFNGRPWIAQ